MSMDTPLNPVFLTQLLNISKQMAALRELDQLLPYLLNKVVELVGAQRGCVILLGTDDTLEFSAVHDTFGGDGTVEQEVSRTILEQVIQDLEPHLFADALTHPLLQRSSSTKTYQLRSVMCVPLISQANLLGLLYVENRSRANIFAEEDLQVLSFFANQVAVAVENALLNADLQASRERLVIAREEERRRLRRDLHDDLGPTLATLALEMDRARRLVSDNPPAITLINNIKLQIKDTLADIRRIVHDLRPPALDDLGLISALEEHMLLRQTDTTRFTLLVPQPLPELSAAMEAAIYRIITEAMNNCLRHAKAERCMIQIDCNGEVAIVVEDDGVGLPVNYTPGIGLRSIRERAEELGGTCQLSTPGSGTRIRVVLPLPQKSK